MSDVRDNAISFVNGDEKCWVSFNSRRFINKVKRLHEKFPEEVSTFVENQDGSVYACIPVKWIKINPGKTNMTDEQRQAIADRFRNSRENGGDEDEEM